jgi:hypothetical protein
MVRVISAHHFAAQDVATCPPTECSTVAENYLLLATDLHQVEVRDLMTAGGQLSHVLHTVDMVVDMQYSPVGQLRAAMFFFRVKTAKKKSKICFAYTGIGPLIFLSSYNTRVPVQGCGLQRSYHTGRFRFRARERNSFCTF